MRVVKLYRDFSDPDGFPSVFVMDDGSAVLTSEKRGIHLDCFGMTVLESTYKSGFSNPLLDDAMEKVAIGFSNPLLDDAMERVAMFPVDFDPICRMLYNRMMA